MGRRLQALWGLVMHGWRVGFVAALVWTLANASGARAEIAQPERTSPADRDAITLVLTGDIGLNATLERTRPDGGQRHGTTLQWATLIAGIAAELKGDLVFGNLETVVTNRNDLPPQPKAFNFRTHPNGVRHLIESGFNLFSTANNHAADFGRDGMLETLAHLDALGHLGLKAHAGLGRTYQEAVEPRAIATSSGRLLLSAAGIGGAIARAGGPGQIAWNSRQDFSELLRHLARAEGNYRMLSVHYGTELSVAPAAGDVVRLRDEAVRAAGVDLVIGHHAHVAAGIQEIDGKLIFYGLGNFLHMGTQDMSRFGLCRDYGMLARLHLMPGADGRLSARAVEVVPVTGTHSAPRPMAPEQATKRIHVLNSLANGLDAPHVGAAGLRLTPQADGRGLYCFPGANKEPGRVSKLCAGWMPALPPGEPLADQISADCGRMAVSGRERLASKAPIRRNQPLEAVQYPRSRSSEVYASVFGQ